MKFYWSKEISFFLCVIRIFLAWANVNDKFLYNSDGFFSFFNFMYLWTNYYFMCLSLINHLNQIKLLGALSLMNYDNIWVTCLRGEKYSSVPLLLSMNAVLMSGTSPLTKNFLSESILLFLLKRVITVIFLVFFLIYSHWKK